MSTTLKAPRKSKQKCQFCGITSSEDNEVIDGICYKCEEYHVYCALCKEWQPEDGHCRHVFFDKHLSWCGSGSNENGPETCEDGFYALLDFQGKDKAMELRMALRQHKYYFQWRGSIIGPSDLHASFGGQYQFYFDWLRERDCYGLSDDIIDRMGDGLGWLCSLWCGPDPWRDKPDDFPRTPKLDILTAKWIDDWLRRREIIDASWAGEFEVFAGIDGGYRWCRHTMPGPVPSKRLLVTMRPVPPSAASMDRKPTLFAVGHEQFLAIVVGRTEAGKIRARRGYHWPETVVDPECVIGKAEKVVGGNEG